MQILITGGSGFLGRALTQHLLQTMTEVVVTWVSRRKDTPKPSNVKLIGYDDLPDSQHRYDVIINLAGAGIADKRWTQARKKQLLASRLNPTQAILDYIAKQSDKPTLLISGSATGWYGIQPHSVDENSSAHDEFTHQLCAAWEQLALSATEHDVTTVIVRTGVVMSPEGGMIKKLKPIFSLGLGGKLGDGKQHISWISLSDWVRAVTFIIDNHGAGKVTDVASVYNLTAPHPITNAEFTQRLGDWLGRPTLFSQPAPLLKLIFGEMSVLLLGNQQVSPKNLLDKSFNFADSHFSDFLEELPAR